MSALRVFAGCATVNLVAFIRQNEQSRENQTSVDIYCSLNTVSSMGTAHGKQATAWPARRLWCRGAARLRAGTGRNHQRNRNLAVRQPAIDAHIGVQRGTFAQGFDAAIVTSANGRPAIVHSDTPPRLKIRPIFVSAFSQHRPFYWG